MNMFNPENDNLACADCGHRFHHRRCWSYGLFIDPMQQAPVPCDCEGWGDSTGRKARIESRQDYEKLSAALSKEARC